MIDPDWMRAREEEWRDNVAREGRREARILILLVYTLFMINIWIGVILVLLASRC